jgi:hypothetical protein
MMIEKIVEKLGMRGTMISGSKTAYMIANPDHEVFFNACVFNGAGVQVWFGDIDLTLSSDAIQELTEEYGVLYVTREQPFRFKGLEEGRKICPEFVRTFKPTIDNQE